jgi:hypothetical protein
VAEGREGGDGGGERGWRRWRGANAGWVDSRARVCLLAWRVRPVYGKDAKIGVDGVGAGHGVGTAVPRCRHAVLYWLLQHAVPHRVQ